MTTAVKPRITNERATCDGRELFSRNLEGVTFAKRDGTQSGFPLDWRQGALGAIQSTGAMPDIQILQKALARILILRPSPLQMETESRGEVEQPSLHFSNILSWYRSLSQEQEWTDALRDSLQNVWPDFKSFKLVDLGLNTKTLQLRFDSDPYFFHQLSDGERALVGLYMVRAHFRLGQHAAAHAWREALRSTTARADQEFLRRRLCFQESQSGDSRRTP